MGVSGLGGVSIWIGPHQNETRLRFWRESFEALDSREKSHKVISDVDSRARNRPCRRMSAMDMPGRYSIRGRTSRETEQRFTLSARSRTGPIPDLADGGGDKSASALL